MAHPMMLSFKNMCSVPWSWACGPAFCDLWSSAIVKFLQCVLGLLMTSGLLILVSRVMFLIYFRILFSRCPTGRSPSPCSSPCPVAMFCHVMCSLFCFLASSCLTLVVFYIVCFVFSFASFVSLVLFCSPVPPSCIYCPCSLKFLVVLSFMISPT